MIHWYIFVKISPLQLSPAPLGVLQWKEAPHQPSTHNCHSLHFWRRVLLRRRVLLSLWAHPNSYWRDWLHGPYRCCLLVLKDEMDTLRPSPSSPRRARDLPQRFQNAESSPVSALNSFRYFRSEVAYWLYFCAYSSCFLYVIMTLFLCTGLVSWLDFYAILYSGLDTSISS